MEAKTGTMLPVAEIYGMASCQKDCRVEFAGAKGVDTGFACALCHNYIRQSFEMMNPRRDRVLDLYGREIYSTSTPVSSKKLQT